MENAVTEVTIVSGVSESKSLKNFETYFANFILTPTKIKFCSAFALGSFFGCALRSSYQHTKGQQLRSIRSGFALGVRALGIATILSVSGVGLFIVSVSAALRVDSPQQFGQKMVSLCGDRFRINRGESVTTFSEHRFLYCSSDVLDKAFVIPKPIPFLG
uniref:Transmembrane protein 242 n=1 Tax=Wuchereria bancrofti TaxID=6293 RepID=A0A1I8EB71_WUCBA